MEIHAQGKLTGKDAIRAMCIHSPQRFWSRRAWITLVVVVVAAVGIRLQNVKHPHPRNVATIVAIAIGAVVLARLIRMGINVLMGAYRLTKTVAGTHMREFTITAEGLHSEDDLAKTDHVWAAFKRYRVT